MSSFLIALGVSIVECSLVIGAAGIWFAHQKIRRCRPYDGPFKVAIDSRMSIEDIREEARVLRRLSPTEYRRIRRQTGASAAMG